MRTSREKVAKEAMSSEMGERSLIFRVRKTQLWHRNREHDLDFGNLI